MNNPRVSVVIPLYNKEKYICRAIDSVLGQTYQNYELTVVNDGSTDNGPQIIRARYGRDIQIVDQANLGVSAARNRGITESRGQLIAFLDADDEWLPDFLDTVVNLADKFPTAGAYAAGYRLVKAGNGVYRSIAIGKTEAVLTCYFDHAGCRRLVSASSVAVPKAVFDRVGVFRLGFRLGEDVDMWFRIALQYPFAYSPRVCAVYHHYLPDNACHTVRLDGPSPLQVSLLEAGCCDPVLKRKATEYVARQMAEEIVYHLYHDVNTSVRDRLHAYRDTFGVDVRYLHACVLSRIPRGIFRAVTSIRLAAVRWVLGFRSKLRKPAHE